MITHIFWYHHAIVCVITFISNVKALHVIVHGSVPSDCSLVVGAHGTQRNILTEVT